MIAASPAVTQSAGPQGGASLPPPQAYMLTLEEKKK